MTRNNDNSLDIVGTLLCNPKGYFGFVSPENPDGEDIYISGENMAGALNGDKVVAAAPASGNRGHREGRVIKILERANKTIVGVIYKEKDGFFHIRPDSRRIYTKLLVSVYESADTKIGDRVSVSELEYDADGCVYGSVTSILGNENSLKSLIGGILIDNGIKQEFNAETLAEADKIARTVSKKQLTGREDLREKLIFTIDGDDAKDFDDAISLEVLDNGNYYLGVHIADVSEYIKENSALDNEAYERGTSVYLADRVIPMLPEGLSNGICSLNPDVDRLTFSCFMEINTRGEVVSHHLAKTVIRSKERMTYNNVNKLLDGKSGKLRERYEYMLPTLCKMQRLSEILHEKRIRRGAIDFDFPECRVIIDKDGEPKDIVREERGVSNRMIEEFMLLANETVAEYAFWAEAPFIYRTHEPPSYDKIKAFNTFLMRFGLQLKGKVDENNPIKPKALQRIMEQAKDTTGEKIIASELLRSMMKAKYTPENTGHFGLAAKYYCHFTSPIRRYPDLVTHRILKKVIKGENTDKFIAYVSESASNSTEREISAELAERDTDDLMKAAYMSHFVGKDYDACIANVTGFGIFVELDNTVEGLIRLENMTDDYYYFDENSGVVVGKRTGRSYAVGDPIKVILARSDIMTRQIDFIREEDEASALRQFLTDKKSANSGKSDNSKKTRRKYYKRKKKR